MGKTKIKIDPSGNKRTIDVGEPTGPKTYMKKTQKQILSHNFKENHVTASTILPKTPKHKLRTRRSIRDNQCSRSSDSSSDELSSIWAQAPQTEVDQTQIQSPDPSSNNLRQCSPTASREMTVTAEVHCSQGGTKVAKAVPMATADSDSAPAVPAPRDPYTTREDEDFTVQISRKKTKESFEICISHHLGGGY